MGEADFYLIFSEGQPAEIPRACVRIKRVDGRATDGYLVVRIDPPLDGQRHRMGEHALDLVVLATRHKGTSLFPISKWPISVYVAKILENAQNKNQLGKTDLEIIGWADLYKTREDAMAELRR
ncbi:MAG: hypothetical protein U0359_35040 [Byssovorax sp.]